MAAEFKVKYSGSWRLVTDPEVKYSGSWRAVQTIEVKSGGVWREVFTAVVPSILNVSATLGSSANDPGQVVFAGFSFQPDGSIDDRSPGFGRTQLNFGEWATTEPGATGADYEIRCVSMVLGTFSAQAAAVGTWIDLNAERVWYDVTYLTTKTTIANFAIRKKSDTSDIVTFQVVLSTSS